MSEHTRQIDAIAIYPDGSVHVKYTPTECRLCGGPIGSPDVPYCDACVDQMVQGLEEESRLADE